MATTIARHRGKLLIGLVVLLLAGLALALVLPGGDDESSPPLAPIAQAAERTATYPGASFSLSAEHTGAGVLPAARHARIATRCPCGP